MSVNVLGVHIMRVRGLSDAISVVEFVDGLFHSPGKVSLVINLIIEQSFWLR